MTASPSAPTVISRGALRRLTVAILAVGFGSAIAIYFLAGPPPANPLGYDPLQDKRYVHELELYGGEANVLAEEFRDWFVGLWQGQQLGVTIAVLTVLAVLAVRYFGTLPKDTPSAPIQPNRRAYPRPVEPQEPQKSRDRR